MSMPGQDSNGNAVGLLLPDAPSPAGRARAATPAFPTSGRIGLFPEEHAELAYALAQAFDPLRDQVVWESPDPGRMLADDAGVNVHEVRQASGLGVTLGLCAARRALGRRHWIVLVASAESLLRQLAHYLIEQIQSVRSRLLIVVAEGDVSTALHTDAPRKGQFDGLDVAWLGELGLTCRGPISGRSANELLSELQRTIREDASTVLHVRMAPPVRRRLALESTVDDRRARSLRVFAPRRGALLPEGLEIVADELARMARPDSRIVACVEAALEPLFAAAERRPANRLPLPVGGASLFAEARGLALGGCRPFLVVSSRFLRQYQTHVAHELCAPRQRVTIVAVPDPGSTMNGSRGVAPDGLSRLGVLRLLPHTVVATPRDDRELRRLLKWSTRLTGPVAILVPQRLVEPRDDFACDEPLEPGRAHVLSEGQDATIIAAGAQVSVAQRATEMLSDQGVSVGVVDARFAAPVDKTLLRRLSRRSGALLTLEEQSGNGGLGTAVLEQLAADGLAVPILTAEAPLSEDDSALESAAARTAQRVLDLLEGRSRADAEEGPRVEARRAAGNGRRTSGARRELDLFGFTEEALRLERELVKTRELSPPVAEWAEIYSAVGDRNPYLWKWCERGAEITTLPCVLPQYFDHVWQTKVLSIVLCVLLDDVADRHGQERFLDVLLRIVDRPDDPPAAGLTGAEQAYADVTRRLAQVYFERIAAYPCHDVYRDLLDFDQLQFSNALRYSHLLNRRPSLLNMAEHDLYLPHNMHMMSFATLDLMCSPGFSTNDLGKLREAIWHAQCMGRIGNLLASWRRECVQRDYTSGVFARAVVQGDLTLEELSVADQPTIETAIRTGGHERYFFRRWQHHQRSYRLLAADIRSVDLAQLLEGHERFLLMHLGSRGLI